VPEGRRQGQGGRNGGMGGGAVGCYSSRSNPLRFYTLALAPMYQMSFYAAPQSVCVSAPLCVYVATSPHPGAYPPTITNTTTTFVWCNLSNKIN